MELKTYFAQDAAGNIISSAIVNVFLQGTTTLATGLTRADGTPLENPFAADGAGRIQFRAPDGYYDVQVSAGSGIIQTLTIQCVDYSEAKSAAQTATTKAGDASQSAVTAKNEADRAEAAADRADVSAEQAQNALNSITGINTNFEQNSREQWRRSLAEAGLTLVSGSFEEGATVTKATDAVWHIAVGQCYTWDGALPKVVPADSTPTSTGGVGPSAWVSVGDASLRTALQAEDGAKNIGFGKRKLIDNLNDIKHSGDYSTLQQAINDTIARGRVLVSPGVYSESISTGNADIEGSGYSSILKPGNEDYAIKVLQSVPHWERRSISKVSMQGTATSDSVGVLYDPNDMLSGRWDISYVGMSDFGVCIKKPTGNIGNTYQAVNFRSSEYGYRAESVPGMHSGCDTFRDCYFQGISKYCVDIVNAQDGGGYVQIQDSIMEQCPGGGIRIEFGNIVPYTPITIRNVWFELIATAATVNRDGVDEVPRQIKAINAPMVIAEDCYLTNIELVNSTLLAKRCRIDDASNNIFSLNSDAKSCFMVDDLIADGRVGSVPTIRSVAAQKNTSGVKNLSLRGMPVHNRTPSTGIKNGVALAFNPYTGTVGETTWAFTGTTTVNATCVADGTLDAQCAEITVPAGNHNLSNENASVTPGKWYVWGVDAKLLSGSPRIQFTETHTLGEVYLSQNAWTSTFGIAKAGASGVARLYIQAGGSSSTIRFANYFIVQFDSEKDALEFCNARMAVK